MFAIMARCLPIRGVGATTLAASITAVTGAVFACNILPTFPNVGGSAPDAQTVSLSFQVVGTPTETFS